MQPEFKKKKKSSESGDLPHLPSPVCLGLGFQELLLGPSVNPHLNSLYHTQACRPGPNLLF